MLWRSVLSGKKLRVPLKADPASMLLHLESPKSEIGSKRQPPQATHANRAPKGGRAASYGAGDTGRVLGVEGWGALLLGAYSSVLSCSAGLGLSHAEGKKGKEYLTAWGQSLPAWGAAALQKQHVMHSKMNCQPSVNGGSLEAGGQPGLCSSQAGRGSEKWVARA